MKVDEWVTQRERLSHTNKCVIDSAVTVWVITGHRVACNARAFYEWTIGAKALLIHVPNNAAVNWLKTIAHVRKSTRHDDRHRVVKKRTFHLVLQLHWLHRVWVCKKIFLACRRFNRWCTSSRGSGWLFHHSFCNFISWFFACHTSVSFVVACAN